MTPQYKHFQDRAQTMQYHFQDVVDKGNDVRMQAMRSEMHELVNDLKEEKHPRDIEARLNTIKKELEQARYSSAGAGMSQNDIEGLHHSVQQMHDDIRQLPNY